MWSAVLLLLYCNTIVHQLTKNINWRAPRLTERPVVSGFKCIYKYIYMEASFNYMASIQTVYFPYLKIRKHSVFDSKMSLFEPPYQQGINARNRTVIYPVLLLMFKREHESIVSG